MQAAARPPAIWRRQRRGCCSWKPAATHINFHYFDEGSDTRGDDLEALVEGVKFVRSILGRTGEVVEKESVPGKCVSTREQIREFARNEAWGHHASCTCKMGLKGDEMPWWTATFARTGPQS